MGGQLVEVVQVVGAEAAVQAGAEALGGLGGVLGDVAGDLLGAQLPGLILGAGDVADVELLAPAGIPLRAAGLKGRAGHPHSRDGHKGLSACHGVHRPRVQGQGSPPGQAFRRDAP
jgi:hypothetical protein